jgi:hypothetical protein
VFTNHPAGQSSALWASALWSLTGLCAATALAASATLTPAHAAGVGTMSCFGGRGGGFSCSGAWAVPGDPYIRVVPQPLGEAEKSLAASRDRRWLIRCHPVIARDYYGVARYLYAAPGCEYGVGAD